MVTLFTCEDPAAWRNVLDKYWDVLETNNEGKEPGKLLELEKWYQEELPKVISHRSKKQITMPELIKVMEWMVTRGVLKPKQQELVASNSEQSVENVSREAFRLLPNAQAAITALTSLNGVGPVIASAVLTVGAPEQIVFMSDEAMESIPGLIPVEYTPEYYALFLDKMTERAEKLNKVDLDANWTPHKVEMCLWAMNKASQQLQEFEQGFKSKNSSLKKGSMKKSSSFSDSS